MSFLTQLADQVNSQFNLNTNDSTGLNAVVNGQGSQVSSLGQISSQFNKFKERRYVEEGYLRTDPFQLDPKRFEILMQEPSATVLFKKRNFSSIAENFRPDFMDQEEKLYYKSMCLLFENKCNQISALEKLSKIQAITSTVGSIDDQLIPVIFTLTDQLNNSYGNGTSLTGLPGGTNNNALTGQGASSFFQVMDRLRTLYTYNQTALSTTWVNDPNSLFQSTFGTGTGVIEITNFTSLNTTTTVNINNPGSFSMDITDPYESMWINDFDIEKSLSQASNWFYNRKDQQFGITTQEQIIANAQLQLNQARQSRGANLLTFYFDANTISGTGITVSINNINLPIPFSYSGAGIDGATFAGIGGAGNITVSPEFLFNGAVAGRDGLNQVELGLFQVLVTAVFAKMQLMNLNTGNFQNITKGGNYVRQKLRANYSGQLIIQPMDVVHIYMNTKSRYDHQILTGLSQMFAGMGILQNVNNTNTDFKNSGLDSLFRPSGAAALQAEKALYVGASFPNYLWLLLRRQFVTEKEGTHVFAGVVNEAVDNWSNGSFNVSVNGTDNTAYFDQGMVNFKPGVDTFNGAFFDPLTPFKTKFDSISSNTKANTPELLEENKYLISNTGSSSLLKNKLGPFPGEKTTQSNYLQDRSLDPTTGRMQKVFYAPDGLVYKWKEGIGVFTQFGSSIDLNDPNSVGNANTFADPFAGQDVMNALSLLITGIPYNFITFYKTTSNLYGFSGDPQNKQNSSYAFINSLRADLVKRNTLWGNFIPFKQLVMNESAVAQAMKAQSSIQTTNDDLDAKLKQFSDLNKTATILGAVNALSQNNKTTAQGLTDTSFSNLTTQINNLQTDITNQISSLTSQNNQFYGNSNLDPTYASHSLVDGKSDPANSQSRKEMRRQINSMTRRMSYDVRSNQDKNLFIVDDYYDTDYDIAAFNQELADGIKLYNNEFTSVKEKIRNVAQLLNLEVFCDTQGHIRVRPPQYNKMPTSVFYRMMYLKNALGIQIFPQFLNDLFTNQLETLREKIEIIEDEIRLDCAILGYKLSISSDQDSLKFITSNSNINSNQGGTFTFLSNPSGIITNVNNLIQQANGDVQTASTNQNIANYKTIKAAGTNTKSIFNNGSQYVILFSALQNQQLAAKGVNTGLNAVDLLSSSIVQQLITRINTKSGQKLTTQDYIIPANGGSGPVQVASADSINIFKVTKELTDYIQQWQQAVKLFYQTIKNTAEYKSLDDNTSVGNPLVTFGGTYNNSHIPEVYEHMLEDEAYDDYGFGSGQRYVIKRAQIRSMRMQASAPPFTSVEVKGVLNSFAPNANPTGLDNSITASGVGGGNGLVTAIAMDYDMWRNYGFKSAAPLEVPFLSDPESQCGPYAAMVLSRNRSEILQGNLTISGNEFMQPGEVIYLEDRGLLFYVSSVNHSFSNGSDFTTSLTLNYGHTPGTYIPTYIDTIGKLIYKNREISSLVVQRQDTSGSAVNVGVVQADSSYSSNALNTGNESGNINNYSTVNSSVLNNILFNTAFKTNANNTAGNNINVAVELRLYFDNTAAVNSQLMSFANSAMQYLTGGAQSPTLNSQTPKAAPTLSAKNVSIVKINLDDPKDSHSPSQKAIDAARNSVANTSQNNGLPTNPKSANPQGDIIRKALFGYIVDCWVNITQVDPPNVPTPTNATNGSNMFNNNPPQPNSSNDATNVFGSNSVSNTNTNINNGNPNAVA